MAKKVFKKVPSVQPMPEFEKKDRITFVSTFNHEHSGDQPYSLQNIFFKKLDLEEQPYSRRIQIGTTWTALIDQSCWITPDRIGAVILENLESPNKGATRPSQEERDDILLRIVEIGYARDSKQADLIFPGAAHQKFPNNPKALVVRSQHGTASCRLHVFSK